ncbi:pyroglutamyl-peptidase I [Lactobacillus sp. UCMA15818]|uniref:pyroglutamyl-peptidase I n=1 Tax=Lactobacillus sp. UCMA15818 TaxID=2583394 RepID=UPI0025B1BD7F|nr:pyroglutamyl-peptidase I [Lactobacillus sp. UCMA15818]MDN2452208.1 pyroglutamyl-peptidase I [Lactobacillus sp. UCMA15818]
MKVLLTGFDPFGDDKINPAIEAVRMIPDKLQQAEIFKLEIPTVFNKSAEVVYEAILKYHPDIVLNIGQAGGRYGITPERVAINLDDARIPDNEGQQPLEKIIHSDGENAYFSQLPIRKIVEAINKESLHSYISTTAGTFVCNHIMYQVQYMIDKKFKHVKGGFIHIPFLPSQVINKPNTPCLSIHDDVIGITKAIEVIVNESK